MSVPFFDRPSIDCSLSYKRICTITAFSYSSNCKLIIVNLRILFTLPDIVKFLPSNCNLREDFPP